MWLPGSENGAMKAFTEWNCVHETVCVLYHEADDQWDQVWLFYLAGMLMTVIVSNCLYSLYVTKQYNLVLA